jgi:hypothetical protein
MSTVSIEEVRESSKVLADIVDSSKSTSITLIKAAGKGFADALADVPDKPSAAAALYAAGRMMAEVSLMLRDEDSTDRRTSGTIASYGISMVYAADILINN